MVPISILEQSCSARFVHTTQLMKHLINWRIDLGVLDKIRKCSEHWRNSTEQVALKELTSFFKKKKKCYLDVSQCNSIHKLCWFYSICTCNYCAVQFQRIICKNESHKDSFLHSSPGLLRSYTDPGIMASLASYIAVLINRAPWKHKEHAN